MAMQQFLGLLALDALADRDQIVLRHQLAHRLRRVAGEADIAVGEDAGQLAGFLLDDGNAGDMVLRHQAQRLAQRGVGVDGHRIDDHAGFEFLDPPHLLGLPFDRQVAVDHADAAGLRHGNRQPALGHGVHGGRNKGDTKLYGPGETGTGVHLGGHDPRLCRLEQHVVEGQRVTNLHCASMQTGPHYTRVLRPVKYQIGEKGGFSDAPRPSRSTAR